MKKINNYIFTYTELLTRRKKNYIFSFLVNETITQTCYHGDKKACGYLFANTGLTDKALGFILLVLSVFVLVVCLILLVNMLNSLLKEKLAKVVTDRINSDLPYVPWLTG